VTTFNELDFGPSHAWLSTRVGQLVGVAQIEGSRAVTWARGRTLEEQPVNLYVNPWQGLGGNAAGTRASLLYLLRQLEELAGNSDLQPVYVGWTTTAAPGAFSAVDGHDGWYVVNLIQPPYRRYVVTGGTVTVPITVTQVAPATPSSLATWFSGAALSSTYAGAATPLVGFPLGSTVQAPTAMSRTGGEGAIPLSASPVLNPVPFVRPGTVAGLYQGGVRVYDAVVAGGNAVPAAPGFANANWVQVYGTQHDFVGDCIVTNGLLLLLFQAGVANAASVYLWNTNLTTPGWQSIGSVNYNDSGFTFGTVREINLDRVGPEEARIRIRLSTSAGNWAELRWKLQRGRYDAAVQFQPLTQANSTGYGLRWLLAANAKIGYDESDAADLAVTANATLAPSSTLGFAAAFGQTANGPLVGWLYQNAPSSSQGLGGGGATDLAFGDAFGPAVGVSLAYGIFAVPFPTAPNLQAEAEGGTLGTGWSSIADAVASAGNTAKVASGTLAGNADLFGTSWVPPPGQYGVPFRIKVTSAASATPQLQVGLWDVTSGVFVPGASTIYAPSQWGTGYTVAFANRRSVSDGVLNSTTTVTSATAIFTSADVGKVISGAGIPAGNTIASVTNATTIVLSQAATATASGVALVIGGPVTPTAGHNMRWRAVTTATLGTDFFLDEAALVPIRSAVLGVGSFPGDIWSQYMHDKTASWVRG
jgi:hypothetical protein